MTPFPGQDSATARRVRVRVGRRGTFLLVVGLGELVWGLQYLLDPMPNPRGLALLTDAAPLHAWAWLWIAAGAVAAVAACVRIGGDWTGFAALLTPPTVWTAAYVAGAFSGSYGQGLWVAVYYATTHVGVCLWASAMPEYAVPAPDTAGKGARG
ncbi:hypothetical protein [Streptomyces johnsoniae]|uniref:Integral membrane protein n=1 Tax=Streptomyces johnsoniae TaxID=3075532 RepID=A0ABU2RYF4_9ACTN|nr:hypothetical protein [Streptomyces sp. DSM 41886]MDT0441786.1 hypothetical protein [Streptomyces sp. DSM 41886]